MKSSNAIKIEFPVLDISFDEWNLKNISDIIFYDRFFYSNSYKIFSEMRLNHKIVDSEGNIYRVIKIQFVKRTWRSFFLVSKHEMIFEILQDSPINFQDFKEFVLNKMDDLESNDFKFKWIESVMKSNNFKELIRGG